MGVKVGRIHLPPRGVTRRRCSLSSKFLTTCCCLRLKTICIKLWLSHDKSSSQSICLVRCFYCCNPKPYVSLLRSCSHKARLVTIIYCVKIQYIIQYKILRIRHLIVPSAIKWWEMSSEELCILASWVFESDEQEFRLGGVKSKKISSHPGTGVLKSVLKVRYAWVKVEWVDFSGKKSWVSSAWRWSLW